MKYIFLFYALSLSCLQGKEFRVITLENYPDIGMFASANQVIGQLYLFETGQLPKVSGLSIDFGKNGLYYDPRYGPNWWNYYFEPVFLGQSKNVKKVYPSPKQSLEAWEQRRKLSRKRAAQIVQKYIFIKPNLQQKIEEFVTRNFQDHFMIGVHYRGTDKKTEAPRVAFAEVFDEIDRYIPQEKPYALFVATDEEEFLNQARERYHNRVVALEAYRSAGNAIGVHYEHKNNYLLGEEALMDACLLSKCHVLIRTSSNLSLWSTYFNPDLPVVLLNQRYAKTLEAE